MNFWTIFATGLFTGGLTCLAVQGGLLAATIAQREEDILKEKSLKTGNALPIIAFLAAKLVAYTILGGILGLFGSIFQLSLTFQVVMQIAVAIFMIGTALNLLNIHPIFRYFIIQPPKFLMKIIRNETKSKSIFAPAILGTFTIFIPCGTTQAMMALAIGSASPVLGAMVMFVFILGTSPTFFVLGFLATKLGDLFKGAFMKFAAIAIILLAAFNINSALALSGNPVSIDKTLSEIKCTIFSVCTDVNGEKDIKLEAVSDKTTIEFNDSGYSPKNLVVKRGERVALTLKNTKGYGCIQSFTIPKLGIQKVVRVGSTETVEFTAPNEKGDLAFMCGMGMYRGNIKII
jgi:sulfite exporter TauE/SafE